MRDKKETWEIKTRKGGNRRKKNKGRVPEKEGETEKGRKVEGRKGCVRKGKGGRGKGRETTNTRNRGKLRRLKWRWLIFPGEGETGQRQGGR